MIPFYYGSGTLINFGFGSGSTLQNSVADPDPGSGIGCFLTPGSGIRDPE